MESCINEPSDHRAVLIRLTVLFAQCKQYNIWMSILTCRFDTANTVIQWQHHTVQPNNENSFVGSLHSPLQVHSPSTWLCARGGCPVRMVPAAPLPSGYWLGLPNERPQQETAGGQRQAGVFIPGPPLPVTIGWLWCPPYGRSQLLSRGRLCRTLSLPGP